MRDSISPRRSKSRLPDQPFWAELPEEELLQLRLKDLDVSISGTWLEACLDDLNDELRERGIVARAHAWISDEWFSPDNTPGVSIPFYLAHPRLKRLERKVMHDVEGGTRRDCMRFLRHEAGHIVQHAYGLHRRRRWQNLFGKSSKPYPTFYTPDPSSKKYVQHLRRWYAQSHPDEDFAETFAVWLTPNANWRKQYKDWPALEKLEYVDELMTEIAGERPNLTKRLKVDPISKLTISLGEHYKKKRQHYSVDAPSPYDRDLRRVFSADAPARQTISAAGFIRSNKAEIRNLVFEMTGECHVTLDAILDDMIDRCRSLKLRAPGAEHKLRSLTAKLTKKIVQRLHDSSQRQRFAV